MSDLGLITCIVLKGKGDSVISEAMNAGAQGATYFNGKGTGIRQALGLTVIPEKDIIFFIAKGEQIENEFDTFRLDLKWQLIKNKVAKDNSLKITEEELQMEAEKITRYQFQQYGLFYATDEQIANYAKETMKRESEAKRIADRILEFKVLDHLKELLKIENKDVTAEEFNKLFE